MLSIDGRTLTSDLDRAGYRKMGIIVRTATCYEDAEKILEKNKVDIIVINMDYEKANGVLCCKHLKGHKKFQEIPVVVTSVQTSTRAKNSAISAGADMFVVQPIPRQYFVEKIKSLLDHATRSNERVDIYGEAKIKIDKQELTMPIGDISSTGIFLITEENWESGVVLKISFEIPGNKKPILCEGELVRVIRPTEMEPEKPQGLGVRFTTFENDSQERLEKYIAKTADKNSKMFYYV